uniref:Dephospho-CoA kinase n=1 Tax=Candidatus Kentrum sp. TUN TaxID=2126343 RepID=A0A451A9K2_9GAMM|nr:MAG: dephospho-CoA kinase [Candidatus Kentron sp. TUN]VFK58873.1 MAG: dephospho-CoA kinase [Candidatus Kentron sp. TUN]VFK62713.1 MAG: dephospho-CoA kinase [Candidatus Kentron sp. TUN]
MNTSRPIALTGGIAAGKTTVARTLAEQGIPIIDADEIARELVKPGQPAFDEILSAFGTDILDATGRLDRGVLRTRVFSTPANRERIEGILHPRIKQEMWRRVDIAKGPYCVLAIPLLLEASQKTPTTTVSIESKNSHTQEESNRACKDAWQVTRILVVDTPVEQQIQRARQRDGTSATTIKAIIFAQASRDERLAAADDVIMNDGNLEHLRKQTIVLHHHYLQMVKYHPNS